MNFQYFLHIGYAQAVPGHVQQVPNLANFLVSCPISKISSPIDIPYEN